MTGSDAVAEAPMNKAIPSASAPGLGKVRSRFLQNMASNAAYIAASTIANLWMTPFLIGHLGLAAFGMIPLVTTITSYMSVLTNALNTALSRFLVIDLEEGDIRAANSTFNTTLFALVGILLALSPILLGISLAFPTLFNVPPGWERDASLLFVLVTLTSFVAVVGSNFAVSPFIHSQFLLSNTVNLVGLLTRVGIIVLLFSLLPAHLWYSGGGALFGGLIAFLGFVLLWRRLTPELHVRISAFDRSRLQSLMGMGGWVIVNTLGNMLLSRVDLLVVNVFFGAALTGGYGSVAQFAILIEHLASAAATVLRPVMLIKYAQQDLIGLQRLARRSVKLLGLALALPVGLLCGFSRPLLSVWLGPDYQFLSILLVIIVCHLSLNLSVRPLLYVLTAFNKIRGPGIVTLFCGGLSLGLAVLFAQWGGWGAAGVALAVAVAWTVKNALYMPIYTAHIMELAWWSFLPTLIPTAIATLIVGMTAYELTLVRMPDTWLELASSMIITSLLYLVGVWELGLSPADRQLLRDLVPWRNRQRPVPPVK